MKNVNICSHQDTVITLTNPFCDSLSVPKASLNTSGWELLEADGSNTVLKLPISLGAGNKKKILIRFTPGSVGLSDTKLSLTLFHDVFFKDTALNINCGSYRNATVIGLDSIDVGTVSICSLRDTNIIIRNLGCETLRIDSMILTGSSEFSIGGGFVMPRQLFPDSAIIVPIRFLPRKWVESIARIVLYFNATGDSLVFPLSLHGEGVYGNSTFIASASTPLYTFPTRTICDKEDSITFRFRNTGCDTTGILKVDFSTTSASIFTPSFSQIFPYVLDPSGNTYTVRVKASPRTIGHHTASCHLQYQMSDNTIVDTTYSFEFDVTRGTRIMKYSLVSIDLGNNALCDARDTVIEMQNIGCDSVQVKSISLQESHYSIVKSTKAPFTLLAGAKDSVWLQYSPTTVGSYKTDLRFETNTDIDSSVAVPIYAATLDKNYIQFRLQSPDQYLVAGDTLRMNVIPDLDWTKKEVTALEFDLIYNGNLFTFINTFHNNPFRVDTSMISQEKRKSILHVKLTSNTDIPLSKDSVLLYFTFLARLSDTLESTLQLKNIRLNNGDGFYDRCILSSSSQDTTATLSLLCGESILYRFLRREPLLQVGTITPNPVTRESNYTFTIPFTYNASGEVHVELIGTSGKVYLSHQKRIEQSGKDAFIIDLSKLPAGNYEYILRSNDMQSLPIRGRVVLLK
jgi:hypothetical protein